MPDWSVRDAALDDLDAMARWEGPARAAALRAEPAKGGEGVKPGILR